MTITLSQLVTKSVFLSLLLYRSLQLTGHQLLIRVHLSPHHSRATPIPSPTSGTARTSPSHCPRPCIPPLFRHSASGAPIHHLLIAKQYEHARSYHVFFIPHLRTISLVPPARSERSDRRNGRLGVSEPSRILPAAAVQ